MQAGLYHEPPHSLFLNPLVFLLLFPLRVGVVRGHRLGELLDFACDRSVIFFEILGVLQDAVEVFLQGHTRERTATPAGDTHEDWLFRRVTTVLPQLTQNVKGGSFKTKRT